MAVHVEMQSYGSYEVVRIVASSEEGSLYSARKKGADAAQYVIKLYSGPAAGAGEVTMLIRGPARGEPKSEVAEEKLADFREAVQRQQRAHQVAPRYVAPVYEQGRDARGAWYASRLYPRSLGTLIEGRVRLDYEGIRWIVASMVRGALAFKQATGCSHGNIKLSNVLIDGRGRIGKNTPVLLTDPAMQRDVSAAECEVLDLHAIGLTILQLVRRRQVSATRSYPTERSPEWEEVFGKDAQLWRQLCERLVLSVPSGEPYSLEELETELRRLRPPKSVLLPTLILLGVGLAVAVGGFFWLGGVTITTDPPGAQLTLERGMQTPVKVDSPARFRLLERGQYSLWVDLEGFESTNLALELGPFEFGRRIHVPLARKEAGVVVETYPSADVEVTARLVDGDNRISLRGGGQTNWLPTGHYELVARYAGWTNQTSRVEIVRGLAIPRASFYFVSQALRVETRPVADRVLLWHTNDQGARQEWVRTNEVTAVFTDLSPGTYTMEVSKTGYQPLTQEVWLAEGRGETNLAVELVRGQGHLVLQGNHGGIQFAWVSVNGDSDLARKLTQEMRPPRRGADGVYGEYEVDAGLHEVVARLSGWPAQTNSVTVDVGGRAVLTFTFAFGALAIEVQPPNTEVTLRGSGEEKKSRGSSVYGAVRPGAYELFLAAPGFQSTNLSVTIEGGRTNQTGLIRLERLRGWVTVQTDPAGAQVRGVEAGAAIVAFSGTADRGSFRAHVGSGEYDVEVSYGNLEPVRQRVRIAEGQTNAITARLSYAQLSVESEPTGADVWINERQIGQTPLTQLLLRPGEYRVGLTNAEAGFMVQTNLTEGAHRVWARVRARREPAAAINSVGMALAQVPGQNVWVGRYEVTFQDYQRVMGEEGQRKVDSVRQRLTDGVLYTWTQWNERMPMVVLTWAEATDFCARLTEADRSAGQLEEGWAYRLPTPDEWRKWAADDLFETAVISAGGRQPATQPVVVEASGESYSGLFGILGNVSEWCSDPGGAAAYVGLNFADPTTNNWDLVKIPDDPSLLRFGTDTIGFRVVKARQP